MGVHDLEERQRIVEVSRRRHLEVLETLTHREFVVGQDVAGGEGGIALEHVADHALVERRGAFGRQRRIRQGLGRQHGKPTQLLVVRQGGAAHHLGGALVQLLDLHGSTVGRAAAPG